MRFMKRVLRPITWLEFYQAPRQITPPVLKTVPACPNRCVLSRPGGTMAPLDTMIEEYKAHLSNMLVYYVRWSVIAPCGRRRR